MYEMHVGEAVTGSGLVWHVVAHDHAATLCGQPLGPRGTAETDRHCLPCMAAFQESMRQGAAES